VGETAVVGETIDAEVISHEGGRLSLKTANGTVFSAYSGKPLAASPGDMLRLTVTGKNGDVLVVEKTEENPTPRAALKQLGESVTVRNLRLAAALTASQLPLTAQVWDKLSNALSSLPELSAEQAVFMLEHKVPVNKQNVIQLQRMDNQEHKLGRQLQKLETLLTDDLKTSGQAAAEARVPVTATGRDTPAPPPMSPTTDNPTNEKQVFGGDPAPKAQPAASQTGVSAPAGTTASVPERVAVLKISAPAESSAPNQPAAPANAAPVRSPTPATGPVNETPARLSPQQNTPLATDPSPTRTPEAPIVSSNDGMIALRDKVSSLFGPVRAERGRMPGEGLNPAQLSRDIAETLRAVSEKAAGMPPARQEAVLALTREIAEGVQFAQQLDRFATVVQWPLLWEGRPAEAEMYVFRDGKDKKKIDPCNATLFLSLTTACLGRVESLIRVIGKNVECEFRLESKKTAAAVQSGANVLRDLLERGGFSLTRSSFEKQDKPSVGPLAVREVRNHFGKRYNFEAKI